MKKLCIINLVVATLISVAFYFMIKIDNESRLPQNIDTDYFMKSLPWIYVLLFSLVVLFLVNLFFLFKKSSPSIKV